MSDFSSIEVAFSSSSLQKPGRNTERFYGPKYNSTTRDEAQSAAMDILDGIFNPHVNNLNKALERTSKRHGLLLGNLANLNTPGYKRRDMDFNIALEDAEGSRAMKLLDSPKTQISPVEMRQDGNGVDMEREVYGLAETETRFQYLVEMTARYFGGLKNVIREGR